MGTGDLLHIYNTAGFLNRKMSPRALAELYNFAEGKFHSLSMLAIC